MNCFNIKCDKQMGCECTMQADMSMCGYRKKPFDGKLIVEDILKVYTDAEPVINIGLELPMVNPDSPVGKMIRDNILKDARIAELEESVEFANEMLGRWRDTHAEAIEQLNEVEERNEILKVANNHWKDTINDAEYKNALLEDENIELKDENKYLRIKIAEAVKAGYRL